MDSEDDLLFQKRQRRANRADRPKGGGVDQPLPTIWARWTRPGGGRPRNSTWFSYRFFRRWWKITLWKGWRHPTDLVFIPVLNDDDRKRGHLFDNTYWHCVDPWQDPDHHLSRKPDPWEIYGRQSKNFDPNDAKMFVLQIFEQNVYRFLECLKKLNLKRNLIEQVLYNSSRNEELQQLLRIEKVWSILSTVWMPMNFWN